MHNKLKSLPHQIGFLTNLRELNCMHNKLKSQPQQMGLLVNLRELDCEHNKLRRLPSMIINLRRMIIIRLNHNPLELTQQQIRFMDMIHERVNKHDGSYYKDNQNVHNSGFQRSLNKCLQIIMDK